MQSPRGKKRFLLPYILGIPVLAFALGPFPGIGLVFPIWDALRGHPGNLHGTHPSKFAGLWIREEYAEYDSMGLAFYLMPDGKFIGRPGMYSMQWHFDGDRLYTDFVSRCGNGYFGNQTSNFTVEFLSPDRIRIVNTDKNVDQGIGGTYVRLAITEGLKHKLEQMDGSSVDKERIQALVLGDVIKSYERVSGHKR